MFSAFHRIAEMMRVRAALMVEEDQLSCRTRISLRYSPGFSDAVGSTTTRNHEDTKTKTVFFVVS
jgi:hypothetical protein